MITRCPVCRPCIICKGKGKVRFRVSRLVSYKARCLPCLGSGSIEVVSRAQCELEGKWLPIDKVAGLKARERGEAA